MASFSVVNNVASMNAQANLTVSNLGLNRALTRLSSGLRINNSGDDAAGLAVANGYRADVADLTQGIRNGNDGLSSLQIVDGALNNISTLLDRLATLASQSASTNFSGDRGVMDAEFGAVLAEIDREAGIANLTAVMNFSVFVGGSAATGTIAGTINAADSTALAINASTIDTAANAATALAAVKTAVGTLGDVQGSVGSLENTMQYAISLAQTQAVNIKAAESRIRDANVAEESANMTRFNILTQSGVAALAQANQSTSAVLNLLR